MLRKLLLVGIFAGTSASIPILYQSNPDAFMAWMTPSDDVNIIENEPPVRVARVAVSPQETMLGRRVMLRADERGHFFAEFRLNGRMVDALVDTGATVVAMNVSTARRIGITLSASEFVHEVRTANGTAKAASTVIERLQLGKIAVSNVEAVILDDRALDGTLIGMSFLKRLGKFEIQNGALILQQ